ncbi:MAG: carboxyl transferase domain-containing protein, partial [Archangium sp.]
MRINEQQYPVLSSHAELRGPAYDGNREQNLKLLEPVNAALAKSREGGGARYNDRHRARGKLLPRERVELLLDRDSHFLELCPLAGNEIDGHAPGASVIGGIGRVSGVECLISANESTVKGGSMSEYSVVKSHRLAEIAQSNRLPLISLTESGGADLPNQDKIFVPGGKGFRDLSRKREQQLPTETMVVASSAARGADIPGMGDYTIFVKK